MVLCEEEGSRLQIVCLRGEEREIQKSGLARRRMRQETGCCFNLFFVTFESAA